MTDIGTTNAPSAREGWTTRVVFSAVSIVLAFVVIGAMIVWGNPANVLHQTALNSSFYLVMLILAGFGVGSLAPTVIDIFKR